MAVITGTVGNDTLNGTTGDDQISGLDGNDSLNGSDGNDVLDGGTGDDTLTGGAGADQLIGGTGNDTASYSSQVTLNLKTGVHTGEAAGDTFSSIEVLSGSNLNDTFIGNGTTITFNGSGGTDIVDYSASAAAVNVSLGAAGVTTIGSGGDAQNNSYVNIEQVIGSAFADTLTSSTVGHSLQGGAGSDIYVVGTQNVTIVEAAGNGDDEIRTTATSYSMAGFANVERLTFTGTGNAFLTGNAGDNIITGGTGDDTLTGGAGADQLIGGTGNDTASYSSQVTLNLKTGVHTGEAAGDTFNSIEIFSGSASNDTFIGNGTTITFNGGTGTDIVDYSTSAAAVNVTLGAAGVTTVASGGDAQGNSLLNIEQVIGSAFNDTLGSSTSGHSLAGGAGNDTYTVGSALVSIVEAAGGGDDEIRTTTASYSMAGFANVERLTFTGTGNAFLTGNAGDNIITGGTGDDTLTGGAGADQLIGGTGNDTASYSSQVTLNLKTGVHTGEAAGDTFSSIEAFAGSNFNDTFFASSGADNLNGGAGTLDTIDYSLSGTAVNVNLTTNVVSGGDAAGDILSNFERVVGSSFNDTLASSTSGHALVGGAGDDIYLAGAQGVTITEAAGEGTDEIRTALATYSMAAFANVERLTFTGTGNAILTGNAGDNIITGGIANDALNGGDGNDQLNGGDGVDALNGGNGVDQLNGGNGDDMLSGGADADQFFGGAGTDTASYVDSSVAMTFDLNAGVFSGIGAGDTFDSIEVISGTNFGDTFIASAAADRVNGGVGVDMISYSAATSAIGINLTTSTHSGFAAGDTFAAIEVVHGSQYDDTFIGDGTSNIFIGGSGADFFDGAGGYDSLWYLTSSAGVTLNLATGAASNGDAAGDSFTNIETVIGSNFDDTLTAATSGSRLEGGGGSDIINGGDGADIIYGGLFSDIGALGSMPSGFQADHLFGGAGSDSIYSVGNRENDFNFGEDQDTGTTVDGGSGNDTIIIGSAVADGGADNDTITVWGAGTANGGSGNDTLIGEYIDFQLFGGDGLDTLKMKLGRGFADGGNSGDIYHTDTVLQSTIQDTGIGGNDYVYLDRVANFGDLITERSGDDLILVSEEDRNGGITYANSLVILKDWYDGHDTIEFFVLADGTTISGGLIA
nr:calcium-binding protein [Rhizobium leguminosarum]